MEIQEHPMTESAVTDYRPEQGEQQLRQMPGDAAKNHDALHPKQGGSGAADDENSAPEEDSQSENPGDPRPPHQTQPPTKEQY